MVKRCGRSLSLILTVLTFWPSSVEGQAHQQGTIDTHSTTQVVVCQPADGRQHISTDALRINADMTTVGRAEVRLAVGVITRYLSEQAVFWIRSLIASQPHVEE